MKKTTLAFMLTAFACMAPAVSWAGQCGPSDKCIFVMGNSITHHLPDKKLGWFGDWGMAATTADDDFVSQFAKLMSQKTGVSWKADVTSGGDLERNPAVYRLPEQTKKQAQQADIVIVELGDNFNESATSSAAAFSEVYGQTLAAIRPTNGKLFCVSTWWATPSKNKIISEACRVAGGTYVDITGLQTIPANVAGNQQTIANKGVAAHPSDKGMRAIAERIFKAANP
jgi:alpha-galactosidase